MVHWSDLKRDWNIICQSASPSPPSHFVFTHFVCVSNCLLVSCFILCASPPSSFSQVYFSQRPLPRPAHPTATQILHSKPICGVFGTDSFMWKEGPQTTRCPSGWQQRICELLCIFRNKEVKISCGSSTSQTNAAKLKHSIRSVFTELKNRNVKVSCRRSQT